MYDRRIEMDHKVGWTRSRQALWLKRGRLFIDVTGLKAAVIN